MKTRALWTMRDGTKIRITAMTDSHLLNTIRMLERNHAKVIAGAYAFAGTLNGEMAQLAMDEEISRLEDGDPSLFSPSYALLCAEAKRRGLK